jgi:hypothetical protein
MSKRTAKKHRKNPAQLELDLPQRGVFTPKIVATAMGMLKGKSGTTRRTLQKRFRWNEKRARRFIDRVVIDGYGYSIEQKREGMDTRYTIAR